ncbi:hypothetical protein [Methylocapsa acidiphila]|uniref:hypothetical protein n=1 Tax=Methylocapsa acidiphila TaxID=133552 RepID=UPI0004045866|nr:hypothetical protein [Methylocapsa acidiphila]
MSISAINTTSQQHYTAPTQTVSPNAKAADGDYKTSGAGRVKDADGDYKPVASASAPKISSSAVQQALTNLKTGG